MKIYVVIALGMILYGIYMWKQKEKRVTINEKGNKEFFIISDKDKILMNSEGYFCSQLRKQDLQDMVEMNVVS
jgi:hypothetical protein